MKSVRKLVDGEMYVLLIESLSTSTLFYTQYMYAYIYMHTYKHTHIYTLGSSQPSVSLVSRDPKPSSDPTATGFIYINKNESYF